MLINILTAVGTIAVNATIQTVFVAVLLRRLSRLEQRRALEMKFRPILLVLVSATFLLFLGNVIQMIIWAGVFLLVGEFAEFRIALYHSIVNFSTLGYGDIVMSPDHRILGAFEATNGILMLGLTTSTLYAVLRGIMSQARKRMGVLRGYEEPDGGARGGL